MDQFHISTSYDGRRSFNDSHRGNQRRYGGNSFQKKPRKKPGYFKPRDRGGNPRSRLGDDDESMGGDEQGSSHDNRRFTPYIRGGRARGGRGGRGYQGHGGRGYSRGRGQPRLNRAAIESMGLPVTSSTGRGLPDSQWYKVLIPHTKKLGKDYVLQNLTNISDVPFIPKVFTFENTSGVFYIQSKQAAEALRLTSRRITTTEGTKMTVLVQASGPPPLRMNEESVEKLKVVLSKRYNPETKALDLSSLYNDEDLKSEGLYMPAFKAPVASKIISIIQENIPELEVLNLSNNRLNSLDAYDTLQDKATNICRVNLSCNELSSEHVFGRLSRLPIVELWLDQNPLCDRFQDESSYVRMIRKKFPKITRLDGHDLPPTIGFDLENTTTATLPATQGSYFGADPVAKELLCRFLEQYFAIFDSDNRQGLLEAYHEKAIFSMCCAIVNISGVSNATLKDYMQDSRNLMRIKDSTRRHKMLRHGRLNVVAKLTELPETRHDLNSLVVDVTHVNANILSFVVTGIFRERSTPNCPLRAFSRMFVTVKQGPGLAIVNEELTVYNTTKDLAKKAFKDPDPTPAPSTSQTASPAHPVAAAVTSAVPTDVIRLEMIRQFSLQSNMNVEWSRKCLEENLWDYDKSALIFTGLHAEGKIPPEAFIKV